MGKIVTPRKWKPVLNSAQGKHTRDSRLDSKAQVNSTQDKEDIISLKQNST